MTHIESFEDVVAWQRAKELNILLYGQFRNHKDYAFKDQLLRASVSIMNNIAEGFDRGSHKELKQFLVIARGSAAEVRSMLILAGELGYIEDTVKYMTLAREISRLLTGFIKSIH